MVPREVAAKPATEEDNLVEGFQTHSQEVASQTLSVGRDLTAVPCLPCQPCQSLTSILVNRGVVPLKDTVQEVRAKVAGRLALFHNNWLKVTHDQWVLETVQGYRLEFLREPVQTVSPRELQTSLEQGLIQEEIQNMLQKGAITELNPKEASATEFYSSLFLVPKKDGGMRLINLKHLNKCIVPHHFKMERIHTLKNLLRRNDWMTNVDLKYAYFMILILASDRPVLCFSTRERSYQFT